jgi:tetratricopeptide (TPR) repeat protein
MARENYFLMLGLDPDRENSWPLIEPKILVKRNEWSQQSILHPTRKIEFKHKLDEVPNIERLLKDEAARNQEADEARTLLKERRAKGLADLEDRARLTSAKGYLTPQDVKALVAQGGGRWNQADVDALAARLKIPIQALAPKSDEPEPPRIPDPEPIQRNLRFLGKPDLYEFLGAPYTTSARVLKDLADRKYQEQRNLPKSPEVTANQELIGQCLSLFANEAQRARYDNTLKWLELEEIRRLAENAGTGEGKISAKVTEELIRRGKKENIASEKVIAAVREVADRRKWLVEVSVGGPVEFLTQRCGRCKNVDPTAATHCSICRWPLKVECPVDKTVNPSDAAACAKCAFAIGDMPQAERLVRDAKGLSQADPSKARALLNEALVFWPGQPEAVRLLADLARRDADLARRDQEVRRFVEAVEVLCRQKKFMAARTEIVNLEQNAPGHPRLAELRKEIGDASTAAEALVRKARALEQQGKLDDAIDAYAEALEFVKDHPEAQAGMSRCPPDPPSLPAFKATSAGVTILWKASPSRGRVTYLIVRKSGSQPTRTTDGDDLARPTVSPFTDQAAEPGQSYYYAVFAERGGVASARPVVVGPVVRTAEVSGLRATVGDGKVELHWSRPKNLRAVEVWRLPGAEPKAGEGTRLTSVQGESALDQGLTNGTSYGYRVVALFNHPDGRPRASEGVTCLASPVAPPKAITDLKVYRIGNDMFEASWGRLPVGDVRIYRIANPAALRPRVNQAVSTGEADKLGDRVPSAGATLARGQLQHSNELHLLPITVLGQSAVFGQMVSTNWVDDVEQLEAWADGGSLRASWEFPNGFDLALIAYRPDRAPEGPDDPHAKGIRWTRNQSNLNGGFQCPAPSVDRVFLTVYTMVNREGRIHYSMGKSVEVAVNARRRARYRVVPEKKLFLGTGRWNILITTDGPTFLPKLVLVTKPDGYPLSSADGRTVLTLPATDLGDTCQLQTSFIPPLGFIARNARLFPADDQGGWLELIKDA